jgi:hypothetical protein
VFAAFTVFSKDQAINSQFNGSAMSNGMKLGLSILLCFSTANAFAQAPSESRPATNDSVTNVEELKSNRTAGVFTNKQMNEYLQVILNDCNVTTEFQAVQGSNTATDAIVGCLAVPKASTVWQPNAVAGYVNSSSPDSHSVGGYFQSRALGNNTQIWGANSVVQVEKGVTGAKLTGLEVDMNQSSGVDNKYGGSLDQDGVNIISGGTNHPRNGLGITAVTTANYWQEDALFGNYQTIGVQVGNGAAGSIAHYIIPPDDTTATEVVGRNHANNLNAWIITNGGGGIFKTVQSIVISPSASFASDGIIRLAAGDSIKWRNSANDGDVSLAKDSSDRLLWNGNQSPVASASFATIAAASENVTVKGMTSSGHCTISPTNANAAADSTGTYVSAKASNQITIAHPPNAGRTWDILCTAN